MRVSRDFTLTELVASQHADLVPTLASLSPQVVIALCWLVHATLQPLRDAFGPTFVSSGYRSRSLNDQVGGASSSRHLVVTQDGTFAAADVWFADVDALDAFGAIARGETGAEFDRCCLYESENRLHVDIQVGADPRGLLYVATDGEWRAIDNREAGEM